MGCNESEQPWWLRDRSQRRELCIPGIRDQVKRMSFAAIKLNICFFVAIILLYAIKHKKV